MSYLGIYLNDHLAGATAAVRRAERTAKANDGRELSTFLRGLVADLAEDRRELEDIMRSLGVKPGRRKQLLGRLGEQAGMLKLNGRVTTYSPLSRLAELDALSLVLEAKRLLWVALAESIPERVGIDRLDRLIARAEQQRAGLDEQRRVAAQEPFAVPA